MAEAPELLEAAQRLIEGIGSGELQQRASALEEAASLLEAALASDAG